MTLNQHESVERYDRYARHVSRLASAFGVVLNVNPNMNPAAAKAGTLIPTGELFVSIAPVTDESTYAVALHEIGHLLSPLGRVHYLEGSRRLFETGEPTTLRDVRLKIDAERAAWEWAHYYALEWTPTMQAVEDLSFKAYLKDARRFGVKL